MIILNKEDIIEVIDKLKTMYPDAKCELNHENPFQLLISTVLSAQTTDKKVNEVTEKLYKDYPDINSFLDIKQEELEERIKKIGLYKNKSKNIVGLVKKLHSDFNDEVPRTMEELTSLPGVGTKTANVVMSNAFGIPAFAVDTHVFRVSNRIGLVKASNVEKTEKQLRESVPRDEWILSHHLLIFHGRRCCIARNPKCEECKINLMCDYYKDMNNTK